MAIVTFNNTNNSLCNLTVTLNANPSQPIVVNGVTFPFSFNPEIYGFGPNDTDGLYTFNCADCRYDHIVEGGNITTTTTTSTTSTTSTSSTTSTTSTSTTTTTTTIDPTVDVELRWLINSEGTDTLQLLDDNSTYTPLRVEPFSYNNSTLGTVLLSVEVDALNGFEFTGVDGELTYEINGVPIVSGESNIQHNIAGFTANYNSTNEVWSLTIAITGQSPYGELVDGEVFILEIFGDAITTTTTTEFVPPEFLCDDASPIIATGEVGQEVVLSQPLSEGVLEGIAPQYYVEGDQTYTVEIKIPAGYQDVGQSIFCDVNAIGFTTTTSTTTLPTLLCEDVDIVIGGGLEGTPVIDTITTDIGTVDSVTPQNFVSGTNDYMVTILVPQGYDNDTLVCEVSGIGATTTTSTTLPTLECRDIVITMPDGTEGDTITASATLDGANLTIQQIEHSGSVVTEYMAGFVPYDVVIVVPDGFNNPEPTLSCPFTAFGFAQTTTTTTIEETTTTTTLPAFDCDLVTVKFGGSNPTDGEEIPYGEFTIQVTGYSGDPIVITDIQPAYYDVNQSVYQVTFIIPEGYQGAGTEFTCDSMEITVDPTTTTTTTIEETTTTTTTEEITTTTTEEITTTTTLGYDYFKGIELCCNSTDTPITGTIGLPVGVFSAGAYVVINGDAYYLGNTTTGSDTTVTYDNVSGPYSNCQQAINAATNKCRYDMVNCCGDGTSVSTYPPATILSNGILTEGSVRWANGLIPEHPTVTTCMVIDTYTGDYAVNNNYLSIFPYPGDDCAIERCSRCVYIAEVCGYDDPIYVRWIIEPGNDPISIGDTFYDSGLSSLSWNTEGSNCLTIVGPETPYDYSYVSAAGQNVFNPVSGCDSPECPNSERNVSTTTTTEKGDPVTTTTTEEPTTTTTTTVQTEFTTTYRFVLSGSGYEVKNGNTPSDSVITEMVFGPHSAGSTIPNNQQFWIVSTTGHPFTSIYNSTGGNQASAYSLDGLSIQRSLIQGSVLCSVGPQSTQANSDVVKTIYIQSDGGPEPTTTTTTTTQVVTTTTTNSNESAYEFERCSEQSVVRILISDWTGDVPVVGKYYKVDSGNGEECVEYGGITQPSKYHSFVSASGPFDSCESCVGTTTTTTETPLEAQPISLSVHANAGFSTYCNDPMNVYWDYNQYNHGIYQWTGEGVYPEVGDSISFINGSVSNETRTIERKVWQGPVITISWTQGEIIGTVTTVQYCT